MQTAPTQTHIPCDAERLYWARRILQTPDARAEHQDRAATLLRHSSDWQDIELVRQQRERRIAAERIRLAETAAPETRILLRTAPPPRSAVERASRRITMIAGFLIAALLASGFGAAATATLAATSAQVAAWRAVR